MTEIRDSHGILSERETKQAKAPVRNGGLSLDVRDVTDWSSLRTSAQGDPKGFAHKIHDLVHVKRSMSWRTVGDVKAMQEALGEVKVPVVDVQSRRAIDSSAFPALAGNLTVAAINDSYLAAPTIGQELVTEIDDNKKDTTVVGVLSESPTVGPNGIPEGKPFPLISAGEEVFKISHLRDGRRVVITQEMIEENDVAGIVQRLDHTGRLAAKLIEKLTLRRVMDVDGSGATPAEPYALHNPAAASLYSATANTPGTRTPSGNRINNNPLTTTASIETARVRLTTMNDPDGDPIPVDPSDQIMLVPDALWVAAWKLINSDMEPGVFNEGNFFGGKGPFRPRILSSVHVDDRSATAWYLGAFRRQFVRKWKLRPETIVLPGTADGAAQSFLDSRIGFQARVAWDCEIGAVDYVYVVQSLAVTTAPS